jgi:hypothetical protein
MKTLETVLNNVPFSQLQQDVSHNIEDIVYGAFRNPSHITIPKLKMIINKKKPSFDFIEIKGQFIYSFLSFAMDDNTLLKFLTQDLLSIPTPFSSEYAYDYILYTFGDDLQSFYDYETFLDILITGYHMRNLPLLFLLFLQYGKENFATSIRKHPIFLSEIKSASDLYRKKMLDYTTQLHLDTDIEKWFTIMTNDWGWIFTKTRWFGFNNADYIWWKIAMKYGIQICFYPFVSTDLIIKHGDTWRLHKAYELLRQRLRKQYKVRQYKRYFRFVLFEMVCQPEKNK